MTTPSDDVRRELERLLNQDQTRVGQVYRLDRRGLNPDQIAKELGVSTSGFVSNARTMARGLLEGHVPSGPAAAQQVLSFVRKASKSPGLSGDARKFLQTRVEVLDRAAGHGVGQLPRPAQAGGRSGTSTSSAPATASAPTLRAQLNGELRVRVGDLTRRIRSETGIDPVDYWAVTTGDSALDVVVRLIRAPGEQGTFQRLVGLKRIDLTLEEAVVAWAEDLPLQRDLVEEAAAKKDWFS